MDLGLFYTLEELYIHSLNILNNFPMKLPGLQTSFESIFIKISMYSIIIEVFDHL